MVIYVIRHGETDWNTKHWLQGTTDIPLNRNGIEVAEITSEALKGIPFDVIFSSPLKRAYQTAEIMKRERQIPLIVDERLELQLQFSVGEINGRVSFIYDNDVPQEERKRIATINDLYSLLNRLRRERRNDGQAQQRVAEWESMEAGNRLKWCNNDIERMVGLIHETFAMYSVCLALCVFWRFVFSVQNSAVFRQGRLELKECLLVVSLDPFAVAPA